MTPVPIRLGALAAELGREVEGDAWVEIHGAAALDSAGPGDLAYVRSTGHAAWLTKTRAAAVILPPGVDARGRPAIRSPHPGLDFARAVRHLFPVSSPAPGVHATASVEPGAKIDETASVGPRCAVGANVTIGPHTVLHPGVVLYAGATLGASCVLHAGCVLREGTVVGDRVILQPGVVLGGDGFGYVVDEAGSLEQAPQIGRVVVEDDVEIGANTTVDRGTLGDTRIGRGAKIDNLVQVGHNCRIGEGVVVIAQVGVSGSTTIERGAMIMGQAGLADHLTIGARAFVGPQSGVHCDVADGERVMGTPHGEMRLYQRRSAALNRLPGLLARVRALERQLGTRTADSDAEES